MVIVLCRYIKNPLNNYYNSKMKRNFCSMALTVLLLALLTAIPANTQEFKVRGRLHMDAFYGLKDADNFSNGFNNRRARLGAAGKINDKWDGQIEVDFADGGVVPNDFRLRRLFDNGGRLWIGQFKVPQGLNQLTSSNSITFIERSSVNNIIPDARRMGVAYELFTDDFGFKTMVFGRALAQRAAIDADNDMPIGVALRGVYSPKIAESNLHFAASVAYEDLNSNYGVRYNDRPESRDSKGGSLRFIDVSVPDAINTLKLGTEFLYMNGPFSVEAEYLQVEVSNNQGNDPTFFGWHVQSSYVLTGESRGYSKGAVGSVSPSGDSGAWEIAARYSVMNLNDAGFTGGEQNNITVGVNHYVTSKLRFMANVIFVDTDRTDNAPVLGVLRAQYNF
jgi:phosphate-selective porin OprO and OprP